MKVTIDELCKKLNINNKADRIHVNGFVQLHLLKKKIILIGDAPRPEELLKT